ncbi:MAG: hypothetical protein ACI4G0_02615, partial [Ruminococcus sp.]
MNTSLSSNAYNLETLPPYAFPLNTHLNKGYRGNTTAINPSTSQQQTTIGGGTVINNILIIPFATENSKVDKW